MAARLLLRGSVGAVGGGDAVRRLLDSAAIRTYGTYLRTYRTYPPDRGAHGDPAPAAARVAGHVGRDGRVDLCAGRGRHRRRARARRVRPARRRSATRRSSRCLVVTYVAWGAGLRVNLAANWSLLQRTGASTNILSKAGYALARRRGARVQRFAAGAGYVLAELVKEAPYYAGAFGAAIATDSISANHALIFLAGREPRGRRLRVRARARHHGAPAPQECAHARRPSRSHRQTCRRRALPVATTSRGRISLPTPIGSTASRTSGGRGIPATRAAVQLEGLLQRARPTARSATSTGIAGEALLGMQQAAAPATHRRAGRRRGRHRRAAPRARRRRALSQTPARARTLPPPGGEGRAVGEKATAPDAHVVPHHQQGVHTLDLEQYEVTVHQARHPRHSPRSPGARCAGERLAGRLERAVDHGALAGPGHRPRPLRPAGRRPLARASGSCRTTTRACGEPGVRVAGREAMRPDVTSVSRHQRFSAADRREPGEEAQDRPRQARQGRQHRRARSSQQVTEASKLSGAAGGAVAWLGVRQPGRRPFHKLKKSARDEAPGEKITRSIAFTGPKVGMAINISMAIVDGGAKMTEAAAATGSSRQMIDLIAAEKPDLSADSHRQAAREDRRHDHGARWGSIPTSASASSRPRRRSTTRSSWRTSAKRLVELDHGGTFEEHAAHRPHEARPRLPGHRLRHVEREAEQLQKAMIDRRMAYLDSDKQLDAVAGEPEAKAEGAHAARRGALRDGDGNRHRVREVLAAMAEHQGRVRPLGALSRASADRRRPRGSASRSGDSRTAGCRPAEELRRRPATSDDAGPMVERQQGHDVAEHRAGQDHPRLQRPTRLTTIDVVDHAGEGGVRHEVVADGRRPPQPGRLQPNRCQRHPRRSRSAARWTPPSHSYQERYDAYRTRLDDESALATGQRHGRAAAQGLRVLRTTTGARSSARRAAGSGRRLSYLRDAQRSLYGHSTSSSLVRLTKNAELSRRWYGCSDHRAVRGHRPRSWRRRSRTTPRCRSLRSLPRRRRRPPASGLGRPGRTPLSRSTCRAPRL